jgi:hypothetical protein
MPVDVHWWDYTTPIEEVMQGLNNLVKAGKGESWIPLYVNLFCCESAHSLSSLPRSVRHPGLGHLQGKPVCPRPWSGPIRMCPSSARD